MDAATDTSSRPAQIDEWKAEIRAIHDTYMTRLQEIYDEVGSGEVPDISPETQPTQITLEDARIVFIWSPGVQTIVPMDFVAHPLAWEARVRGLLRHWQKPETTD